MQAYSKKKNTLYLKGSTHQTLSQQLFLSCLSACIREASEGWAETQEFMPATSTSSQFAQKSRGELHRLPGALGPRSKGREKVNSPWKQ